MKLRKLRSRHPRPAHRAESGRRPDRLGRGPDQPVWPSCVGERKRRREPLVRPAAINRGWGKGAAGVQGAGLKVRPAAIDRGWGKGAAGVQGAGLKVRPAAIDRGWGKGAAGVQGAREPLVRPAAAMLAYKAGLKNEGAATGYRNRQWKK